MARYRTWRDSAKAYIAEIMANNPTVKDPKELRKLFRDNYPFGERKYHPYKIWCDQVKVTLGLKKKKVRGEVINENQQDLFNGK